MHIAKTAMKLTESIWEHSAMGQAEAIWVEMNRALTQSPPEPVPEVGITATCFEFQPRRKIG